VREQGVREDANAKTKKKNKVETYQEVKKNQ
jgi:hypothetical protein